MRLTCTRRPTSRNKILTAREAVAAEQMDVACEQIGAVLDRVDGKSNPPDFAQGSAAPELEQHLSLLLDALEPRRTE
jgi:hypothetical protein